MARDPLVDFLIEKRWDADNRGESLATRIERFQAQVLPDLIQEASAMRALAELVNEESSAAALKRRAGVADAPERLEKFSAQEADHYGVRAEFDAWAKAPVGRVASAKCDEYRRALRAAKAAREEP